MRQQIVIFVIEALQGRELRFSFVVLERRWQTVCSIRRWPCDVLADTGNCVAVTCENPLAGRHQCTAHAHSHSFDGTHITIHSGLLIHHLFYSSSKPAFQVNPVITVYKYNPGTHCNTKSSLRADDNPRTAMPNNTDTIIYKRDQYHTSPEDLSVEPSSIKMISKFL